MVGSFRAQIHFEKQVKRTNHGHELECFPLGGWESRFGTGFARHVENARRRVTPRLHGLTMISQTNQRAFRLGEPSPRRVVILRALKLGDMLCAAPALRALRGALPEAEIVLLGLPWAQTFVDRFAHYLDGHRPFPGFPGLPEQKVDVARWPRFLSEIQAERFDLAVQMHGSGPFVNPVTVFLGARHSAGFYLDGDYCPDPERYLRYPDRGLEIRRLLELTSYLGCPPQGEQLEFPLQAADFHGLHQALNNRRLATGRYVCVHVGASVPERCWPLACFVEVARACVARNFQVVLTGTLLEAAKTREVREAIGAAAVDLAGQTDLGALGALLSGARLLVCNDTGVSHLAAALRVPSVIISTGDNPSRWAPIDQDRHRVVCRPDGVAPAMVLRHAEDLLARYRLEPACSAPWMSTSEAACAPCAF
jgi:ADP-heptose:LPS heptosyltransferase